MRSVASGTSVCHVLANPGAFVMWAVVQHDDQHQARFYRSHRLGVSRRPVYVLQVVPGVVESLKVSINSRGVGLAGVRYCALLDYVDDVLTVCSNISYSVSMIY